MKSTGIFIAALLGLSVLVSTVMLVTATIKPEWFMFGSTPPHADSLQAHAPKDSLIVPDTAHALPGDVGAATSVDTAASALAAAAPAQTASVQAAQTAPPVTDNVKAKADDLQNLVKLYEAMKPEDAAKILGKMPDKEVRSVILHVKKKQAAKILSFFDANRAAQILAQ